MNNIKIFEVVELTNKEKGTILNVSGDNYLVEIAGENQRHIIITDNDIKKVIYHKWKKIIIGIWPK